MSMAGRDARSDKAAEVRWGLIEIVQVTREGIKN